MRLLQAAALSEIYCDVRTPARVYDKDEPELRTYQEDTMPGRMLAQPVSNPLQTSIRPYRNLRLALRASFWERGSF